jgi:hypothetical protein
MARIYRLVTQLSWALGLLSIATAVIVKLFHLASKVEIEPSTFLLAASTFFLCALATRAMERT